MIGWQFQYWNGSAWVNFANAQIDHILEELSSVGGQEEIVFDLPNTPENRALVQSKPFVQALFKGTLIYPLGKQQAIIAGFQYSTTTIEVSAYNYVFVQLSQASQTVTQNYTNTAVGTIAAYICGLAGVTVGPMPDLNVSIKFKNANCMKALQDLAKACGCEYWADNSGFNIGSRDSTVQTLGYVGSNSKRGYDYSKQVDQIIINGVDSNGVAIKGSAGSPGSIATFTEKKVSDVNTLNQLAAFKLQTLNNPSNGNSLECLISQVYSWHPGQFVSANRPDLDLVGDFIIQRITKQAVTCTVEVDAAMPQLDLLLQETDQYADLGTYPMQPSMLTPSALSLQGLFGLYHASEAQGSTIYDSNPNENGPNDGAITNGAWINGAIAGTKVLQLTQGQIDCGKGFNVGGQTAFTVGMWFSPYDASTGFLIGQAGQYCIQLCADNALDFQVQTSSLIVCTTPNNSVAQNGRNFVMAVYDGTNVYIYLNGSLAAQAAQSGPVAAGTGDVLVGVLPFSGVVAEIMLWTRALSAQEIQELYYQPLLRVGSSVLGEVPLQPPVDDGQFGYVILDVEDGYLTATEDLLEADAILFDWPFGRTEDLPYINWGLFGETTINRLEECLQNVGYCLAERNPFVESMLIYMNGLSCLNEAISRTEAIIVYNS
jgi:hypothetical protein